MNPKVRVTGILIESNEILLLRQNVAKSMSREWSLPGGALETGETLEQCLIREMKEETGLDVLVGDLLYVCDRMQDDNHVVQISFLVERNGGQLRRGSEPEVGANKIQDVRMVPVRKLSEYGFGQSFCAVAEAGFADRGRYAGSIENIGL